MSQEVRIIVKQTNPSRIGVRIERSLDGKLLAHKQHTITNSTGKTLDIVLVQGLLASVMQECRVWVAQAQLPLEL